MNIVRMKVEYQTNPIAIDEKAPVFSWNVEGEKNNWYQEAYRIIVSDSEEDINDNKGTVWDSGVVNDKKMVNIVYNGKKLSCATKYFWKVFVTSKGEVLESNIASFETAFFDIDRFAGKWIGETAVDEHHIYRRKFELSEDIKSARAYICGLGSYEIHLNGSKVSDYVLQPGWTNYDKTILYNVYDITDMLKKGDNAVGILLADGMYNVPGHKGRYAYFPRTYGLAKFLMQLEITYMDGSVETIVSDEELLDYDLADADIILSKFLIKKYIEETRGE